MIKKLKVTFMSIAMILTLLTSRPIPIIAESFPPSLPGRLIYHSYNSYGDGSSELFVYNFKKDQLECISDSWTNVKDPMNAVWASDGKAVVFMGMNTVDPIWEFYSWDIFYYEIGSIGNPINLTNDPWARSEDPKIHGDTIIYKAMEQDCNYIRTISLTDYTINTLYSNPDLEPAMPIYSLDVNTVYISGLAKNGEMDIYSLPAVGGTAEKVIGCSEPGVFEYYQVPDANGFFYAAHTDSDRVDQIYYKNTMFGEPVLMPFNIPGCDSADPCVVDQNYTIVSSIRPGGNGGYDLYLCDNLTGQAVPLSDYNSRINTSKNELAAWYTPINAGNSSDITEIKKFILNMPCDEDLVGDLNGDGVVDGFDLVYLKRELS